MILAALAADAAGGKSFRTFRRIDGNPDIEILHLWDESGDSFELLAPATQLGVAEQAQLVATIGAVRKVANEFPFATPGLVGQTSDEDGNRVAVFTLLGGDEPDLARFTPGGFSASIGKALASIHSLDPAVVRESGLPELDATAILHGKVAEVDRIAATGKVPSGLLSRWEKALEDVALYRFHPTVIHGSINQDSLRLTGQEISGVTNWSQLSIGDPAEDLRYLAGGALQTTFEDTMLHYNSARPTADENVATRAHLLAEIELGSWLVYCLENPDQGDLENAQAMVNELQDQLDAGTLRPLRAAGFIGLGAAAASASAAAQPAAEPEVENEPETMAVDSDVEEPDFLSSESASDELF